MSRLKNKFNKWYKHEQSGSVYYSLNPKIKFKRFIVGDGEAVPTPIELFEEIKGLNDSDDRTLYNTDGVYGLTYEDHSAATELPPGCYSYLPENYPLPARLVPTNFRNDKYIEMTGITEKVVENLDQFLASEEIYRKLEVCFKTGILFFGPGGTGKTALIRHIVSTRLPKDSVVISIGGSLPDENFLGGMRATLSKRLKIFILEEFTHFVKDPYDCEQVLTFLDGENSLDKTICFASTNYPEILPHNIVSRHSRIEHMYEIGFPVPEARKSLMSHLLERTVTDDEVALTQDMTADSIKAICLLTWIKKISLQDAKTEVENHLKLAKRNFKGKDNRMGF